jgi:hypothetical protein
MLLPKPNRAKAFSRPPPLSKAVRRGGGEASQRPPGTGVRSGQVKNSAGVVVGLRSADAGVLSSFNFMAM